MGGTVLVLFFLVSGSWAFAQTPLTPATLSFGNQAVNQSSAAISATLKNTQPVPLSISSIAISGGTAPADYVAGGNCPLLPSTLGLGEICRITVTFTPSAPGLRTATLTVTDNALTNPLTVALTGTGVAPVDLTPSSSNFGAAAVGNTSATPSGTLRKDLAHGRPGTLPGRVPGDPIVAPPSGAGNANGLISLAVTPANPSIGSGQTQQFTATGHYQGGSTKNLTASVLWISSAPGVATLTAAGLASSVSLGSTTITATLVTVTPFGLATGVTPGTPIPIRLPTSPISGSTTLTVTGSAPQASLSVPSLTFTSQNVGTTSGAQTITLTNTGNAALSLSSIALTGLNPGDFGQNNDCPSSLTGSSSCTFNVSFAPTAPGTRTASLTITDNSNNVGGSQQSVSLTGTGTGPAVNLNPSTLTFSSQIQGTTSPAQGITLTNTGNASLTISSISLTGANPGDFGQTNNCGSSVAANNGTCTINVTFTPSATGSRTASVSIADDASGSPQTAGLTGTGTAPLGITTPSAQDGTVGVAYNTELSASGGTTPYTWSISSGALPSCLSLSSTTGANIFITGTPVATCEGSFSFTVQVEDAASTIVTQQSNMNINPPASTVCESGNESVLTGQYAFNLSGYNSSGFNAVVGSITADGAGHITGGEVDMNGSGANFASTPTYSSISGSPASTYTVGSDNRGCATIVTASGSTFTTRIVVGSISSGTATQGRIIEFDPANSSAFVGTGQILQQTTADFSTALNGTYAYAESGVNDAGDRDTIAGVYSASSGTLTRLEGSRLYLGYFASGNYGGGGPYTGADSYGRFTYAFGLEGGEALNGVGYMVSSSLILRMATYTYGGVETGEMKQQSVPVGGFSKTSLNTNMVYHMTGENLSGPGGDADIGLISADGNGSLTGTDYDDNAGTWQTPNPFTCSYSVDAYGAVSLSSCSSGAPTVLFYLVAPNQGFMMNHNDYQNTDVGEFEPQTVPGGGFTTALMAGTFFGGTTEIVNQGSQAEDGLVTLSASASPNVSVISDQSSTTFQGANQLGTATITVASTGTFTSSDHPGRVTGLAIDQSNFLIINNTGSSYPSITLFGPSAADSVVVSIPNPTGAQSVAVNGTLTPITVSVTGTTNTGVTWTVNGLTNGNSTWGTIGGSYPTFTYTAPSNVPSPATFDITVTNNADVSKSASLSVTITP